MTLLLGIGLTLSSCTSHASPLTPEPGLLSGVVLAHSSQKSDNLPLADARVDVYRQAVSIGGPVLQNPPSPVAMTTTNSAGEFRIEGLGKGRWFVLAPNEAGGGAWVSFDPATGAVVTLIVCTDCPVPV